MAAWYCLTPGSHWHCHRHGLRLDHPGSSLLPAAEVWEMEKLSGDHGMNQISLLNFFRRAVKRSLRHGNEGMGGRRIVKKGEWL